MAVWLLLILDLEEANWNIQFTVLSCSTQTRRPSLSCLIHSHKTRVEFTMTSKRAWSRRSISLHPSCYPYPFPFLTHAYQSRTPMVTFYALMHITTFLSLHHMPFMRSCWLIERWVLDLKQIILFFVSNWVELASLGVFAQILGIKAMFTPPFQHLQKHLCMQAIIS